MNTNWIIEIRLLYRDRLLAITLPMLLVVVWFAAQTGYHYRIQWQKTFQSLTSENHAYLKEQADAVREKRPIPVDAELWEIHGAPTSIDVVMAAAVPPLAHFSLGQSDLYPRRSEANLWSRADSLFQREDLQSPLTLASGRFDLSFVVIAIVPLIIIIGCFDIVSSDRVSGRLALLSVQAGGLKTLIIRRLAVCGAILCILIVALFIWGLITSSPLLLLLLWCILASLYLVFWLLLSAALGLQSQPPDIQAVRLIAIWLLLVFVLPAGINRLADVLSPLPVKSTFVSMVREAEILADKEAQILAETYLSDHPELVNHDVEDNSNWMKTYLPVQRAIEQRTAKVLADNETQRKRSHFVTHVLQYLSPAAVLQITLSDVAGTGPEHQAAYVTSAQNYQSLLLQQLTHAQFKQIQFSAEEIEALPRFTPPEWVPAYSGGLIAVSIAYLFTLCLLSAVAVIRQIKRISPIQ